MTKIERKRRGPHGAQTAWFYQYLAKGLHKEKNGKRMDRNTKLGQGNADILQIPHHNSAKSMLMF